MPDDTIRRIHQLARRDPLGIMIRDSTGTENMHDPPPEQSENNDDDSTFLPNEEGSEEDDSSIPFIESLNEVAIRHNTDDFEPSAHVNDTTTTTTSGNNENSIAPEENLPEEEENAGDTITAG
eukprot:13934246-Ditylum_brightwellii.AAC.1